MKKRELGWRKISDKEPTDYIDVLVLTKKDKMLVGFMDKDKKWYMEYWNNETDAKSSEDILDPEYWMPLPHLPEKNEVKND